MNQFKKILLISIASASLFACGNKDKEANPAATVESAPTAQTDTPKWKQTEKFGTVSNINLTPLFQAPSKYGSYVRQEISEVTKDEYQKLPNSSFDGYVNNWVKQAASIDKPDWQILAIVIHPEVAQETNEFKKQEAAEKVKSEITIDKNSLNVIYGWQGEMLFIAGPDVTNGEYYLLLRPGSSYQVVSYQDKEKHRYSLYYRPDFKSLGLTGDNRGDMQFTVKVPIEKAREIESLREGGDKPMIRVYGHVNGLSSERMAIVRKDIAEVGLSVEVEALEFGVRRNGEFKTFFFLDSDLLKKSRA